MTALLAVLALASAATPAGAFEGRAVYVLRGVSAAQRGTATSWIGRQGVRTELELRMSGAGREGAFRTTAIARAAEPRRIYFVDDVNRTFCPVDAPRAAAVKVERLGQDHVAGHPCTVARVTGGRGGAVLVCVATDLRPIPSFAAPGGSAPDPALAAGLRGAGLDGLPLRWAALDEAGRPVVQLTAVEVRREPVPAERVAIPAGYRETTAAGVFAPPEDRGAAAEAWGRETLLAPEPPAAPVAPASGD